jgi:type I restriction enzyme, S subunit
MKHGWEPKRLDDVCELITCGVAARPQYIDEGIPFLSAKNVKDGKIVWNGFNCISEQTHKELTKNNKPLLGDILYTRVGSYGEAAVIEDDYEFSVFVSLTLIKVDKNILDNYFLKHYLNSNDIKKLAKKSISSSGVGNLNVGTVREFPIYLPTLSEQQRIVTILDEAFEAIAKAKVNAEQNLKNAKELFESYLQSVFENKGEGWEEKTLGDVCSLYQGIAINAKTKHALVEKSDLPLLRIKDLKNNTVEQYIDPNNYPKNALVNESDIIYTRTGSLGLVFRGKRGVLHNNSFKVIPTAELSKDYLFIWLQNPIFKSKILSLALKAAQPDITHAIFKIQEIAIPPMKDQEQIVQKLDTLSEETKRLEAIYQTKIENLEELKKSILQKAFNGEL